MLFSLRSAALRRLFLALIAAVVLSGTAAYRATPAYAYANCVDVVLRDPYWSQLRWAIQTTGFAAGIAPTLEGLGFAVDNVPSVGAIMHWPAGYYGASGFGHVGIVEAVLEDGSVLVRHENWPYGAAEHLQVFPMREGYRFVHLPPAVPVVDAVA